MREATRDRLLAAARRQFADKGFYGASLSGIADELGMTKQALLYHFRRKEDLYAEVLAQISERLLRYVRMAANEGVDPARQLEHIALAVHYAAMENPEDSRLLMRELLDNQARADQAKAWYLVPFLDGLVAIVKAVPGLERAGDTAIFCFVYQLLGGIEYFAISTATLRRMYGDSAYETVRNHFPLELQDTIRRFLQSASAG